MQPLPIGIQDYRKLREGNHVYVDKTQHIFRMIEQGGYHFLSRPRRFGKSLLVSTLAELFSGSRELFKGLWIEAHWRWEEPYPIVRLAFNDATYQKIGLEAFLTQELQQQAQLHGIRLTKTGSQSLLKELIELLAAKKGPVVLLVDEYDKPIIDYLDDVPQAEAHRNMMKHLYSVLKPLDAHLRFVLLTGVSKFSRVSIFSELNNLIDLTTHHKFADLLGYTQQELEHTFEKYIEGVAPAHGGREALLTKIATWYNGYSWNGQVRVYNPFSILLFFSEGQFKNFWFVTGTASFLVKLLDRHRIYDLEAMELDEAVTNNFELSNLSPYTLLFQTGYITIKSIDEYGLYTMGYPNREVRESLLKYLLAQVVHSQAEIAPKYATNMVKALHKHQPEAFVAALNQLFSSIPYSIFIANKEAYYHTVTFLAIALMGGFITVEGTQALGRPDCILHLPDAVYVVEFKLDKNAQAAIDQIKAKQYATPYQATGKRVCLFGINFSSDQKAIDDWQVVEA